ncbi:MAG: EB domain-containing protein, partial [Patescibacteria group bacterium]
MNPKIKIYLGLVLCLAGILFFNSAFAQQTLPVGGGSFSTAVKIAPGQYQGFALEAGQAIYYYFEATPGQLARLKGQFVSGEGGSFDWIRIYNAEEEELVGEFESNGKVEVGWLLNSAKATHKIYTKIYDDGSGTESFTLDFSLVNKFDANSGTDAGDTFDKFVNIAPGAYNGYLSGIAGITQSLGNDWKDIYKIGLKKGVTYEFKVTPPSKTSLTLSLYDLDRQLLKEESSANSGAIVSLSLVPSADTNVFVSASNYGYPYQDALANYQLEIKSSVPLIKFYACDGQYCGAVGEFDSISACQKTTTKTCYRTENCDGKCGITPPSTQCTKDADCSTGKICKNNKCESIVVPPSGCTKNSDCPAGGICENKKCVGFPIIPQCTKDANCSTGKVCQDNNCVEKPVLAKKCVKDSDCQTG